MPSSDVPSSSSCRQSTPGRSPSKEREALTMGVKPCADHNPLPKEGSRHGAGTVTLRSALQQKIKRRVSMMVYAKHVRLPTPIVSRLPPHCHKAGVPRPHVHAPLLPLDSKIVGRRGSEASAGRVRQAFGRSLAYMCRLPPSTGHTEQLAPQAHRRARRQYAHCYDGEEDPRQIRRKTEDFAFCARRFSLQERPE